MRRIAGVGCNASLHAKTGSRPRSPSGGASRRLFAGGHGFGAGMLDTADLMTSARVTINFVEPFGHVDHYFGASHRRSMEKPILAWLKHIVK